MRFPTLLLVNIFTMITLDISCSKPDITPVSPDVYMITEDDVSPWASLSAMKASAFQRVNAFAESKGKVAITVDQREYPRSLGQFPHFEYKFKLVNKDSQEARSGSSGQNSYVTTEKSKDIYSELIKLDELKKKGILTEAEFETQKKKILETNSK